MMSTATLSNNAFGNIRRLLRNPAIALPILLIYIVIVVLALTSLDRRSTIFPLLSTLAFPPLVLSPFVTLALPIDRRLKAIIIVVLMIIVLPVLGMYDGSYLELAIQICIFSGLALGLNIVVGFAGLLDLGYIAFFAIGAYLWAMFTSPVTTYFKINNLVVPGSYLYLFMFLGVIVAAVGGILLGLPVLRLRGDYLSYCYTGFWRDDSYLGTKLG